MGLRNCQVCDSSAPTSGHDSDLRVGGPTGYTRAAGGYRTFPSTLQLLTGTVSQTTTIFLVNVTIKISSIITKLP